MIEKFSIGIWIISIVLVSIITVGCASTKEERTFLDKLRECGASTTITRLNFDYRCNKLDCDVEACTVKFCASEGAKVDISNIDMNNDACTIEFKGKETKETEE